MPPLPNDISFVPSGFEKKVIALPEGGTTLEAGFESSSYTIRYGLLESALAEVVEKGVITPLPTSKPKHRSEYSDSRLKTIRKRLHMLGYLKQDSGQANLGPMLETGIKAFQAEAKLVVTDFAVDGWVGEDTWTALQELVSFEAPSKLERWFDREGKPCPALKRAVHLRLYAFGLCSFSPLYAAPNDAEIAIGLKRFAELSKAYFQLNDQDISNGLCFDSINLLMDQDELLGHLASAQAFSWAVREQIGQENAELLKLCSRFVLNFAKAELWLMGYEDVAPAGYNARDRLKSFDRRYELRKGSLFNAIEQFWEDRGESSRDTMYAREFLSKYFPLFFQKIHAEISAERGETQLNSDQVYQKLQDEVHAKPDENLIQKVWRELRSIGSRIWDGIKRAWHCFKSAVKKGITWLKNLTRLAYDFILKSFEAVRAVVSSVAGALAFFGKKEIQFPWSGLKINPNSPVLRMRRDSDFDFTTIVNDQGRPDDVGKAAAYLENKASMFALSCKFLASLLNLVIDLIKNSLFTGWAVLLMALLKLYKSIRRWAPDMIAFEKQERSILTHEGA